MDKQNYLKKALEWAKRKDFSELKANHDGYEQPTQFIRSSDEEPVVPDITARRNDRKYYIEIATKTDNPRRTVTKWKLLSTLANMKGGKLFLLAPKGHKAYTQRLLKRYDLEARLLYLPKIAT